LSVIAHSRFTDTLKLVPNQRAYDLHLGQSFRSGPDAEVVVAPALEVLSRWVERISVRIDLLQGRAVPASVDGLSLDQAWNGAVRARSEWTSAFESRTLARSARAADRLLRQWCPSDSNSWLNPDFFKWRAHVLSELRDRYLFSPEDWLSHFRTQLECNGDLPLRLPPIIKLHGFVELTRLEQSMLKALGNRGVRVIDMCEDAPRLDIGTSSACAEPELHSFDSSGEELRAVANWAQNCLQRGKRRLAVVVNGLDALAGQLIQTFDRAVHPRDNARMAVTGDSLYHLAEGSRLAEHAVIDDALLILRLSLVGQKVRHPFPDLSRLLLSPHLAGWPEESASRAKFEARLRRQGRYLLSVKDLESLLRRYDQDGELRQLSGLLNHSGPVGDRPDIAQALLDRLRNWGWPGPLAQTGLSAGRVRRFTQVMERIRQLGPATAEEALATLSWRCRDIRFTERGGTLSPIQLISPEDAAGLRFDAAWVMNIHDGNWPGRPLSNPFLPYNMLRHVPRATPEGVLRFTRKLQNQLECLAPEIHYSWSHSGDDVPRMASPLLESRSSVNNKREPEVHWPICTQTPERLPGPPAGCDGHPWLHAVEDTRGLPLEHGPQARIPGGSIIVKDQSACPLMAYFLHRLQLRFDPMPGPFADYAYRGRLLHEALYQLYLGQQGLPGLPAVSGVEGAVDRAFDVQHARLRLTILALKAERQRLQNLLRQWLEFERQRQGFTVVALEEKRQLSVDGFDLGIRLDRIDRLRDGRNLIIDYKSGAVNATGWTRKRIEEPQLPLYAVLLEREQANSVGGLALASVRTGACRMAGIVDDGNAACQTLYSMENRKNQFSRQFSNWEQLLDHWKSGIADLLREIVTGHAANCLYQEQGLRYAGLDIVMRRSEGEAWLLAHGMTGLDSDEGPDDD